MTYKRNARICLLLVLTISAVTLLLLPLPQTKQCRLIALWHTHGGKFQDRAYFSPADTKTAESLDRPIYMTDYTGTLRVFHPGDRKMSRNNRKRHGAMMGLPRGTAQGRTVAELARGKPLIAGI